MTIQELKTILDRTGVSFAYRKWKAGEVPLLPYGVYYAGPNSPFAADGVVYFSSQQYSLELYSRDKDPELEARVEAVLTEAGIFFEKDEEYLENEHMNEIIYEIEV